MSSTRRGRGAHHGIPAGRIVAAFVCGLALLGPTSCSSDPVATPPSATRGPSGSSPLPAGEGAEPHRDPTGGSAHDEPAAPSGASLEPNRITRTELSTAAPAPAADPGTGTATTSISTPPSTSTPPLTAATTAAPPPTTASTTTTTTVPPSCASLPTTLEQRACRIVGQRVRDDRTTQGTPGVVVGVVLPPVAGAPAVRLELHYGEAVLAAGSTPGTPAADATHWEMGSETKLFTGLLLAWLAPTAADGTCAPTARVCLTDPISRFLPPDVVADIGPQKAAITLLQLATHTSGLPDDPPNLHDGCPLDPVTKRHEVCTNWRQLYTEDLLWQGVQQSTLAFTPGQAGRWLYSDTGFAVLGAVLADVAEPGQPSPPYAGVVATNLTGPLGLTDTGPEVDTDPLLAMGYQYASSVAPGSPAAPPGTGPTATIVTAPRWNNTNAFIGGGGFTTDIDDMTRFVAASLGYEAGPLASALAETLVSRTNGASTSMTMGLAWQLQTEPWFPTTYAFKNGGTYGFKSATVVVPAKGYGVTMLSNSPGAPDPVVTQTMHDILPLLG